MELVNSIQDSIIHLSLVFGIIVSLRSIFGFFSGSTYSKFDRFLATIFIVSLYIQILLVVYIFSAVSFNYEESLKAIEQAALTLFATILAQGGRLITLRSNDNSVKFRFRSIFYGLATGLLIYAYLLGFQHQ